MRSGGKPKPTALKLLLGNPGHRPMNDAEPELPPAVPPVPEHLSPEAKEEYRRVAVTLYEVGILTEIDGTALAMYCDAWARWVHAKGMVDEKGPVVMTKTGHPIQNPYLAIANKAHEQMYKLIAVFGMTPSDRSRLKVEKPKKTGNKYTEFGT